MKTPKPVRAGDVRARVIKARGCKEGRWYWIAERSEAGKDRSLGAGWHDLKSAKTWVVGLAGEDDRRPRPADVAEAETVRDLWAAWLGMMEARTDLGERTRNIATHCAWAFCGVPKSRIPKRRTVRKSTAATVGDVKLARVTTATLERHRDLRIAAGYSTATVKLELDKLREAWRWALDTGVTTVPAPALPPVKVKRTRNRRTPTAAEVAKVVVAMPEGWPRDVLRVLWSTGMRLGEVAALRVGSVRVADLLIIVPEIGKTGEREIPVSREAVAVLAPRLIGRPADAPLWPVKYETIAGGEQFRGRLDEACAAASVPRFTPHGLRRTAVNALCRSGVPLDVAASVMGHSIKVMQEAYREIVTDDRRAAVARASLGAAPGEVVDFAVERDRRDRSGEPK